MVRLGLLPPSPRNNLKNFYRSRGEGAALAASSLRFYFEANRNEVLSYGGLAFFRGPRPEVGAKSNHKSL
jgi:hypothetical protein